MRYHIFCGDTYYPIGGAADHLMSCNDEATAMEIAECAIVAEADWVNVFDSKLCKTILSVDQESVDRTTDRGFIKSGVLRGRR